MSETSKIPQCAECGTAIKRVPFSLFNKTLCSVKCCSILRHKEELKVPKVEYKVYDKPCAYGSC